MKFLLVAILLVSITLTGCSNVKTYTFTKDRVDQTREGNRGYILGTPPPAPIEEGTPKRTMIGIDIEIPILPGEKVKTLPKRSTIDDQIGYVAEDQGPVAGENSARINFEPKKEAEESEEEWIK
ncbi:MAG: hypothetical protein ISS92_00730 [Candidatus Omnitrophica bacterium]|nr:hypothetical protein [Candidatus Omnitrophota bacterium]